MRRLALLGAVVAAVAETYRRGYTAPLIYGVRRHAASRPDWCYDDDVVA